MNGSATNLEEMLFPSADDDTPSPALRAYLGAGPAIGLTRLAPVTGLDKVGLPVAAAYRPNSASVCVNHGKGLTLDAAKASALGEALELYHAETPPPTVVEASPAALRLSKECIPVHDLPQRAGAEIDDDVPLHWLEGRGLYDNAATLVPLASVSMDLTRTPFPGSAQFLASTSGLGAGSTLNGAILHGLCEVIERDAHALWLLRGNDLTKVSPVGPESVTDPRTQEVLARIVDANLVVGLADITSDIAVPTILAVILEREGRQPTETPFALGTACHPVTETAILKAVTEALQMRLLQITALRDDLTSTDYLEDNTDVWHLASHALSSGKATFLPPAGMGRNDPAAALSFTLETLSRTWPQQPVLVDLTREDIGIPVAKVMIPGLEDGLDLASCRLGQRGLRARLEAA